MSRSSSTLWQVLPLAIFALLAALQQAANALTVIETSSTLAVTTNTQTITSTTIRSTTTSSTTTLPVVATTSPPATSPPAMNGCRVFSAALNPCGLEPDQLYYYSNDKNESEFLQYMAIISTLTTLTDESTANCGARLAQFACHYLFPRCNDVMMPMAPCQDYCECTLQETCREQWGLISRTIDDVFDGYTSNFTVLIDEISARGADCENLNLYSDQVNYGACDALECIYPSSPSSSPSSSMLPSSSLAVIVSTTVLGSFFLLLIITCFACCCLCYKKSKKMPDTFLWHKTTADYLQSGDSSILRLARINKRKSKFKSPRELLKQVPLLYSDLMVHNAEYLIQESRIHTTSFLAEGRFSEVYLGNIIDLQPYDTSTFRSVVIKQFKDGTSDTEIVRYLETCLALGSVSHPNVMSIIGISFNAVGTFSMIFPYLEEHDLLTHLRKKRSNTASGQELQEFSVDILAQMVFQICQGMKAISRMRIVYKTLCAHACMVNIDEKQQRVIVGDVSFSKLRDLSEKQSRCSSPYSRWLAPESISDGEFTEKSDVWSFGITCWEVFSFGSQPFADMDLSATPTQKKLSQPSFCPDSLFTIVQGCWNKKEEERPSFADLVVRLDTLLARTSYQQEVAEINREIHSGARQLSAIATVHSTSDQKKVFDPASTQSVDNLETSLKTSEGYLKVLADQDGATADGYASFASTNQKTSEGYLNVLADQVDATADGYSTSQYENDLRLHSSPVVDISNDEDAYDYVHVTPEVPSQTTSALQEHNKVPHKPVTNTDDSTDVKNGVHVYGNLEVVVTIPTSMNQSKSTDALLQEDTQISFKTNGSKPKKPAPLPKPSLPGGSTT